MHTGSSGPTLQQQQLDTQQALTTANLNLEENSQRKSILEAMQGTRVFRGSALSRSTAGNRDTGVTEPTGPASHAQINSYNQIIAPVASSLLEEQSKGSGATPAGGTGASGPSAPGIGGRYAGPGHGAAR